MRKHGFICSVWLVTIALLGLMPSAGFAQVDSGSITGTVIDSTGAARPGVTIVALHEATKIRTQTVTNEQGRYVITPLRVGRYTITAELPGFKKGIHSGIVLQMQERLQLDFP